MFSVKAYFMAIENQDIAHLSLSSKEWTSRDLSPLRVVAPVNHHSRSGFSRSISLSPLLLTSKTPLLGVGEV